MIFWKNQNGFLRKRSIISQILSIHQIIGVRAKDPEETLLFVDLFKAFKSIYNEKIKQIQSRYFL